MHEGCHRCIEEKLLLSISYVACVIRLGCGKLSTAEVSRWGDWQFCGEILALLGEFLASSGFFQPVSGGFVGFLGQNEVETVLFPLMAVDQAVPVEAVVAVKEGG